MKKTISVLLAVALLVVCLVLPITAADHPFTDVSENAWYADNVQFVYEKGLMAGTAADKFSPETKMNRAMLVTVLYRMDGSHAASGTTPFTDIQTKEYYYPALVWAYGNGIINGTAPDKFSPEAPITREMMVTIFYRYAQFKGLDVSKTDSLSKYIDAGKISTYAKTPFAWAVAAGVIYGNSATTLNPLGTATRAECAAILQRFYGLTQSSNAPTEPTEPTEPSADYFEPVVPSEGETPTEPTQPSDPCPDHDVDEPTEHVHCWTCIHEEAEWRRVEAVQCTCGAVFETRDGTDPMVLWMAHVKSFSGREALNHYDCYTCSYDELVKSACDYWWCPSCNTRSDTNPNP
ncbi:MAG: S-layer homology domain-containing protein [Faecousia sp.]